MGFPIDPVDRGDEAAGRPGRSSAVEATLLATDGTPDAVPLGLEIRTDHGPQYTGFDF